MTDSTDNPTHRSRAQLLVLVVASTTILALGCGSFATVARADGDPASDVLATQSLFLPQDAGIPLAQQNQLTGLVQASASSGYPIRVAIVASEADLGSITELWRQPQTYARFLGQELSLLYRGPLLVIMPGGYGFYWIDPPPLPAGPSPLAGLRKPAAGAGLGTAAVTAIQRLATAAGHSVPIPPVATTATRAAGGTDTVPVIALVVGAVLIAAAWTASLRAQPPRQRFARSLRRSR